MLMLNAFLGVRCKDKTIKSTGKKCSDGLMILIGMETQTDQLIGLNSGA